MIVCCGWCGKFIAERPSEPEDSATISHGICPECAASVLAPQSLDLPRFLNKIDAPVVIVNDVARVVAANGLALAKLGKVITDVQSRLGGEVFDCVHAFEPGGCGGTQHCSSCVIRDTVMDTMRTRVGHGHVPAILKTIKGYRLVHQNMEISTQWVSGLVLLRIDKMDADVEQ